MCPLVRLEMRALGVHFVAAHHITSVHFASPQTVAVIGWGAGRRGTTAHAVLRSNPITGAHYWRLVEHPVT